MAQYRPGLRVIIDAPGCGLVSGKVVRPNQKTVTVQIETGQIWRVPPACLALAEEVMKDLVEEAMPFLTMSREEQQAWLKVHIPDLADRD